MKCWWLCQILSLFNYFISIKIKLTISVTILITGYNWIDQSDCFILCRQKEIHVCVYLVIRDWTWYKKRGLLFILWKCDWNLSDEYVCGRWTAKLVWMFICHIQKRITHVFIILDEGTLWPFLHLNDCCRWIPILSQKITSYWIIYMYYTHVVPQESIIH